MMSMTTGDELGKSDVFVKLAVILSPLIEEAVRQGITMKEFERGLFGGLLCTGKQVIDQLRGTHTELEKLFDQAYSRRI